MDRDVSSAVGHESEASQVIATPEDEGFRLPSKVSIVEVDDDNEIKCTACGHRMKIERSRQGNNALVKKGRLAPQHITFIKWWFHSVNHKFMSLSKEDLFEKFNKENETKIKWNPFNARISELVGAELIFEGRQQPPLYRLNLNYIQIVLFNDGKLKATTIPVELRMNR